MNEDPIVEEVRRIRQQMLEECGGDLNELLERIHAKTYEHKGPRLTPEEFKARRRRHEQPAGQSR